MLVEAKKQRKATEQAEALAAAEIKFEGDVKTISIDATTGEIVIETASGEIKRQARPRNNDANKTLKDARITDSNGDTWTIGKDGKVTEFGKASAPDAIADASKIDFTIKFTESENHKFGLDTKTYEAGSYETVKIKGVDYPIAWKALGTGQQEFVNAEVIGKTTFPQGVGFKRDTEVLTSAAQVPSQKQLLLTAKADGDVEKLIAYVKVQEAGKEAKEIEVGRLNVKTYTPTEHSVIIVPVNDAQVNINEVNEKLNAIYNQAVTRWNVTLADKFNYSTTELADLDKDESDIFSAFPAKMKQFNKAFRESRIVDDQAYYIFLIKGTGHQYAGFMPFKRKFGYIFLNNTQNISATIAHELGHGAFRLKHNFSEFEGKVTQGSTDNLMDYNNGTVLKKYQWDQISDPATRLAWLEDDDESAIAAVDLTGLTTTINDSPVKADTFLISSSDTLKLLAKYSIKDGGDVKF